MAKMPHDPELYIPFAVAAASVGISPKRIRNWLDNRNVYLDANEKRADARKHRRFSELDVVRMGIVARLTHVGFSAEHASELVEDFLAQVLDLSKGGFPKNYHASNRDKLLGALRAASLIICIQEEVDQNPGAEYRWFTVLNNKPLPKKERTDLHVTLDVGSLVERICFTWDEVQPARWSR